jgi:hypothetical protein
MSGHVSLVARFIMSCLYPDSTLWNKICSFSVKIVIPDTQFMISQQLPAATLRVAGRVNTQEDVKHARLVEALKSFHLNFLLNIDPF